jgi:hypothetical protein
MKVVIYLTAAAEDRFRREIHHADMVGEIYGDYAAESRLRERALKRLEPYRKVWWCKDGANQQEETE